MVFLKCNFFRKNKTCYSATFISFMLESWCCGLVLVLLNYCVFSWSQYDACLLKLQPYYFGLQVTKEVCPVIFHDDFILTQKTVCSTHPFSLLSFSVYAMPYSSITGKAVKLIFYYGKACRRLYMKGVLLIFWIPFIWGAKRISQGAFSLLSVDFCVQTLACA